MGSNYTFLKQDKFVVMTAQEITSTTPFTSAVFSLNGVNQIDFYVKNISNAGSKLTFTLYTSDEDAGATMYQETSIATTAGVATASALVVEHTPSGAVTEYFKFAFTNLNAMSGKLVVATADAAGTGDVVRVHAMRGAI